jgi:hypothetical protein
VARIVESLIDRTTGEGADHGRFSGYPWDEWCDGQTREVQHGEDFSVAVKTFRVYLYQWQDMLNRKEVSVNVDPNTVLENRWNDPDFRDMCSAQGLTTLGQVKKHYKEWKNWKVRTRIVAPEVIRFYFEPDDQPVS